MSEPVVDKLSTPEPSATASSSAKPAKQAASSDSKPLHAAFTPSSHKLPQQTSPLLSGTPATITRALSQAYPLILFADYVLGLISWTSDDWWQSFLLVLLYTLTVLYFENIVKFAGCLIPAASVAGYIMFRDYVAKEQEAHPTLDSIVYTLNNVVIKANLFLEPLTALSLTSNDITRVFTSAAFYTPFYLIISYFFISARTWVLVTGLYVLTYHSVQMRALRAIVWRSRYARIFMSYVTGLDMTGQRKTAYLQSFTKSKSNNDMGINGIHTADGKPVRFVYVLFENQRRWLGIGWTANLLAYERAPWTDEFLNETTSIESFKLPEADGTNMEWRWVDKAWRLDMTNDGALVNKKGIKSKVDPRPDEGYIYTDNTWKKPSSEDSFSKYTRRRRWVRTAELVPQGSGASEVSSPVDVKPAADTPSAPLSPSSPATKENTVRQRKSLRFED